MSIFIKGMEIPKNCSTCPCFQYNMFDDDIDGYCKALKTKITDSDKYHPNCQLTEVKTPHGRLIDADAHILEIRNQYCEDCSRRKGIKNGKMKFLYEIGGVVCRACEIEDMLNELDDAPTVIEVEE